MAVPLNIMTRWMIWNAKKMVLVATIIIHGPLPFPRTNFLKNAIDPCWLPFVHH